MQRQIKTKTDNEKERNFSRSFSLHRYHCTGAGCKISRVIGETAPLMFTALGCSLIRFSIDKPISAVPLLIWEFFNDPNLQELIWGASLFLLLFVLTLNLTAKYLAKKWNQ